MGESCGLLQSAQHISLPEQQKKQMLALDRTVSDMESKITTLEAQNLHLQVKINPLEREVDRLKKLMQREESKDPNLAAEEIEILKTLSSAGEWLTSLPTVFLVPASRHIRSLPVVLVVLPDLPGMPAPSKFNISIVRSPAGLTCSHRYPSQGYVWQDGAGRAIAPCTTSPDGGRTRSRSRSAPPRNLPGPAQAYSSQ